MMALFAWLFFFLTFRIMIAAKTGTILIAEPFLKDSNFMRTVVLICRHSNELGTFGFTLNKQHPQSLHSFFPEIRNKDLPIFTGGPVQMDTLHYIHQYPEFFDDAEEIIEGVYWGGNFEALKILMNAGKIEPNKIKFFLGYSGWESGQLEEEMNENTWLVTPASRHLIFDTAAQETWKASLQQMGGKYQLLANYPIDPHLN